MKNETEATHRSRREVWRDRFRRVGSHARSLALIGIGILISFAVTFTYDLAKSARQPYLSQEDVRAQVAMAMASATPPPPFGVEVYQTLAPSVVLIQTHILRIDGKTDGARGSGVIIDDSGTVLTSLHVVDKALDIQVVFADGTTSEAFLIARDADNDIAVLRPRNPPLPVVPAVLGNSRSLQVGDEVFALGNPFGIRHSLSAGVVSGLNRTFKPPSRTEPLKGLIQFDAAVNPGNSGGPLINRDGEVVGIVTGLVNPTDQDVFIGIGFAVTIETAGGAAGSPPY